MPSKYTVLTRDEVGAELAEPGWEFVTGDDDRKPLRTLDELREAGFKPEALFLRAFDTFWSAPLESFGYYPVCLERSLNPRSLLGVELELCGGGGLYRPSIDAMLAAGKSLADYRNVSAFRVVLRELSGTHPVSWRRRPVARPKVRTGAELRWEHGRWQKLLKSGWKDV